MCPISDFLYAGVDGRCPNRFSRVSFDTGERVVFVVTQVEPLRIIAGTNSLRKEHLSIGGENFVPSTEKG